MHSCLIHSVTSKSIPLPASPHFPLLKHLVKVFRKQLDDMSAWEPKVHLQNWRRHSEAVLSSHSRYPQLNLLSPKRFRTQGLSYRWRDFSFQLGAHLPPLSPGDHHGPSITCSPALTSQINLSPAEITRNFVIGSNRTQIRPLAVLLSFIWRYFLNRGGLLLPW